MWVQAMLQELQVLSPPRVKVWVDNMKAKFLAFNQVFHGRNGRMKRVKVDYHFVRERVPKNLLDVDYVSTEDQTTDDFTKALSTRKLENFKYNLNLGKV
jgi:hypothetical protein